MAKGNGRGERKGWLPSVLRNLAPRSSTGDGKFENQIILEAYRRILHELALLPGEDAKVVLVTSAVPGEGTSTVARQLAAALAEGRRARVLLIDANEQPASRKESPPDPDTALFSAWSHEEPSFVQTADGFSVLPYQGDSRESYSLHRSSLLAKSRQTLAKRFDWTVIDGRPVTQHTETAALSSHADATVLVLRAESTRSQVAKRALDILQGAGAHVVGAVLNKRRYHIPDVLYRRL